MPGSKSILRTWATDVSRPSNTKKQPMPTSKACSKSFCLLADACGKDLGFTCWCLRGDLGFGAEGSWFRLGFCFRFCLIMAIIGIHSLSSREQGVAQKLR